MITRCSGTVSSSRMPTFVTYSMSASPGMSGATARPPTLRKILSASNTRPSTVIVCAPTKRACPRMNVHRFMPSSHDSTPRRSSSMTLSLRAFTFAMSTVISPVPTPYSAPRRARCAACALATSVLVGMHPVLTQVPPTSLRSIIASDFSAMKDGSDERSEADEECDQEPAADGDDVFADGDRPVLTTVGGYQAAASFGATERAEHRADHAGAQPDKGVMRGAADDRSGEGTH